MRVHNFYPVIDHLGVWKHLWLEIIYIFWKGGSKVQVLGQGDAFNSAPNGLNDLKFCMVGAFMGYYWVLVNSSSCNLYKGQTCSGLYMWLASTEVTWPWLDQNSIVTQKNLLHAHFQVIWSIGGQVTGNPLSKNLDFAPPFLIKYVTFSEKSKNISETLKKTYMWTIYYRVLD